MLARPERFELRPGGTNVQLPINIFKLFSLARRIEHLCRGGENEQALSEAASLPPVARESLELLAQRAKGGLE